MKKTLVAVAAFVLSAWVHAGIVPGVHGPALQSPADEVELLAVAPGVHRAA
ncbi:hypothetical protein [Variovorax sp. J31P207]|uniref:hypothetical protein n=1 Tax=Variovorax sp. J31P207 TaxID=3053510 RepID=UPI0025777472|nr:hypothetical protein [Variovorax sp. J31P207]MDM0071628.1 hypothetical protein [Variovorax sp. J31P207]